MSDWSIHTLVPRFIAPRATENLINKHGCRKEDFYRYLCLITRSIILFKNSTCSASVFFQNGGKRSGRRCFEGEKTFFSSIVGLGGREKRALRIEKIKFCFATNALISEPPALKQICWIRGRDKFVVPKML